MDNLSTIHNHIRPLEWMCIACEAVSMLLCSLTKIFPKCSPRVND